MLVLPRRPWFGPKPVHVRFVVHNVALVQVLFPVLCFPWQCPFASAPNAPSCTCCSYRITNGLNLGTFQRNHVLSEIGKHCIKRNLHIVSVEGVTEVANCTYKSPKTRAWFRPTCRPGSQSTGSTPPVRCVSGSCQLPCFLQISTSPLLPLYLQHHLSQLHTLQHKHSTG
jgi:hypothetical protein